MPKSKKRVARKVVQLEEPMPQHISLAEAQERERVLGEALERVGVPMPSDSSLVYNFVQARLGEDWTLESVVDVLCKNHFLYNYTAYTSYLQEAAAQINLYAQNWKETWRFVNHTVAPHVKRRALSETPYPEQWPWLFHPRGHADSIAATQGGFM